MEGGGGRRKEAGRGGREGIDEKGVDDVLTIPPHRKLLEL